MRMIYYVQAVVQRRVRDRTEDSSDGNSGVYGNVVQLLGGRDLDVASMGVWVQHVL